jgi:hypothetical protein
LYACGRVRAAVDIVRERNEKKMISCVSMNSVGVQDCCCWWGGAGVEQSRSVEWEECRNVGGL